MAGDRLVNHLPLQAVIPSASLLRRPNQDTPLFDAQAMQLAVRTRPEDAQLMQQAVAARVAELSDQVPL